MPKNEQQRADDAWAWANALSPKELHRVVYTLSVDIDAYDPATRKAVLQVATVALGKLKDAA